MTADTCWAESHLRWQDFTTSVLQLLCTELLLLRRVPNSDTCWAESHLRWQDFTTSVLQLLCTELLLLRRVPNSDTCWAESHLRWQDFTTSVLQLLCTELLLLRRVPNSDTCWAESHLRWQDFTTSVLQLLCTELLLLRRVPNSDTCWAESHLRWQDFTTSVLQLLCTELLLLRRVPNTMDDIDVVDKIFEDRFGSEFRAFTTSSSEPIAGLNNAKKNTKRVNKKRTKVRKRSQFESPYQLYPQPVQRRKKRSTNFLNINEDASLPVVHDNVKSKYNKGSADEEEEKVPDNFLTSPRDSKSPVGSAPTVFELMQEVIPAPAFTNDVLITKSLSLPFLEQIEYLRMHLNKRGMFTLEETHQMHLLELEKQKQIKEKGVKKEEKEQVLVVEDIEKQDSLNMLEERGEDSRFEKFQKDDASAVEEPFRMHKFMSQYAHLTSFLDCNINVKPIRRQTSWLLYLIEDVYDERYKAEFSKYNEGEPEKHYLSALVPQSFQNLDSNDGEMAAPPSVATSVFLYRYLYKKLGLKQMVEQTCWDILYTISILKDTIKEVDAFSMYLREIWDENVLIFMLFCRNAIQKIFPVQFKLRNKLIEHVPRNHIPESALTTKNHPCGLNDQKILYLSNWACEKLFLVIFDKKKDLTEYLLYKLRDEFVPNIPTERGQISRTQTPASTTTAIGFSNERTLSTATSLSNIEDNVPKIRVFTLFQILTDIFMSCPDDIIQDIKYGDQGGTLFMLSKLRETSNCDAKVESVRLQLIEEERELASQQVVVDNLIRNNSDGSKRTQLFLAKNELWRLEQIAERSRVKLKEVKAEEDNIWSDVIGSDQHAIQMRKKHKKNHSSVPSDLVNLDMAVQRFDRWVRRQEILHIKKMKAMNAISLSWEDQMEKLKEKAIIRIQRKYRERRAARIAKEQADMLLNIKRAEKKRKREERLAREEAIRKRQLEQERKHQERLNKQKKEEEERARQLKERQLQIIHKHQAEESERRFQEHCLQTKRKNFRLWKQYTQSCKLKMKVFRHEFIRRWGIWNTFVRYRKNWKALRTKSASIIQRAFRAFHARGVLKHIKRHHKEQEERIRMNLIRLRRHLEHRVLVKWHLYAHQQHGIRHILRKHFSHVLHSSWHSWVKYVHEAIVEKNLAATKLQAMQRAKQQRRAYIRNRTEKHAACIIQGAFRAHSARNILKRIKNYEAKQERRAHRAMARLAKSKEARVFHKWQHHARLMKNVKNFMHNHMATAERKMFHHWYQYALKQQELKEKCAILIQRKWQRLQANRLYLGALRKTNAAIVIQKYARQYLQSRTLEWLILYRDAAIMIQKHVRGTIGRMEFRFRRQKNYFQCALKKDYWTCNKAFERNEGHLLDVDGNNMLMWAARGGSKRIVKLCLRKGMDINAYNKIGQTAIHQLISASYFAQDILLEYMLSKGARARSQDFTGSSPLMEAARLGRIDCMKLLLSCNADVNHIDYDGCSILQVAAASNQVLSVNTLLEHKVNIDHRDHDGATVLHDVSARGRFKMLEHILQYVTHIDPQDNEGHTPLHMAIFGNHPECARLLITHGAETDVIDETGRSKLHYIAEDNNIVIAGLLCEANTDLNIPDRDGDTPLHIAARLGHNEIVKILLGSGADPNIRNHDGNNAIHLAAREGHVESCRILIDYHSDINFVNYDNKTPLGEARMRNHVECVKLFKERYIDDKLAQRRFAVALAIHNREEVPPAEEDPKWITVCRGLTNHQWGKVHELANFRRFIHKWKEFEISLNDLDTIVSVKEKTGQENAEEKDATQAGKKFWEQDKETQKKLTEQANYFVHYWYYENDDVYTIDEPQDVRMGHWVQKEIDIMVKEDPNDEYSELVPSGKTRFIWENPKTGQKSDELPPQIVVTRNTKRPRLHKVTTKADITKNEYKAYYEREMGEINLNRAKVQNSILIQRIYRGYRCRVFYARHKIRWYASIHVERVVRGFLGRRKAFYRREQVNAATRIQAHYRGMKERAWVYENYYYMDRRRSIWRAAKLINRIWRGYLCRRYRRRYLWKQRGPKFFDEWSEIRRVSIVRRVIGVWDEMIYVDTYDVLFYTNHLTKKCQWEKPPAVENHDLAQQEDDRQLRLHGFTRKEREMAERLQGIWRGRQAVRIFRQMVRGAKIMKTCEKDFLENPNKIEALCNYTLYLHAVQLDYDRARIMYAKMLDYMVGRGPDNAFVLYAYAIFATATREADFDDVMDMVHRARECEPKTGTHCFDLASKGFFRQAMVFNPKSAQAHSNYAIVLQFVNQDYEQAEQYYLRACALDPYDHTITANFNDMLRRLANKPYDGFDAFRLAQAKAAEETAKKIQLLIKSDEYQLNLYKHEAAAKIQKCYRRYKGKHVFWKFQGVPESLKIAREHEDFHKFTGHEHQLEDVNDWEECSDGLGKTYWFNTKKNISQWSKPQFKQANIRPKKGPGFDGMRVGRLEKVEDWEECNDGTGATYYYNIKTGKSQWIRPRFHNDTDHPKKGKGFGDAIEEHEKHEMHNKGEEKRADWHEEFDENGRSYWYNNKTGASQWLQPHFMSEEREVELHAKEMEENMANIPDGWEAQKDTKGNIFYYCHATGESSWSKPVTEALPPPPWEMNRNEDGTVYFYNTITGESRWDLIGLMDFKRNRHVR
eukprot:g7565.t1